MTIYKRNRVGPTVGLDVLKMKFLRIPKKCYKTLETCDFMGIIFLKEGIKHQKTGTAEIHWLGSQGTVKFQINFVADF
jgi:hypothetical protein